MYRKPRFLEELHQIREQMSREADYDVDLFMEMVRSGKRPSRSRVRNIRGFKSEVPSENGSASAEPSRRRRKQAGG